METLDTWLERNKLSEYAAQLRQESVQDPMDLTILTDDDMKALAAGWGGGILVQRRLISAVRALAAPNVTSSASVRASVRVVAPIAPEAELTRKLSGRYTSQAHFVATLRAMFGAGVKFTREQAKRKHGQKSLVRAMCVHSGVPHVKADDRLRHCETKLVRQFF